MQVRPLYDRILVKRLESQTRTKGGLFLPESAKEKPQTGEVIAVGHGRLGQDGEVKPLIVEVGHHVMFGKFSGTEIEVDGEKRLVLREDDILGIVEG